MTPITRKEAEKIFENAGSYTLCGEFNRHIPILCETVLALYDQMEEMRKEVERELAVNQELGFAADQIQTCSNILSAFDKITQRKI